MAPDIGDAIDVVHRIAEEYSGPDDLTVEGGMLICNQPWIAPYAYLHRLFPPLGEEDIASIAVITGRQPHLAFREFLAVHNGVNLFSGSICLYGVRGAVDRLSDAALWSPFDIRVPNLELGSTIGPDDMVIGGMGPNGDKLVCRNDGSIDRVTKTSGEHLETWPSLASLLVSECRRYRDHYDKQGRLLTEIPVQSGKAEPWPTDPLPETRSVSRRWLDRLFGRFE